jgi:tetratricopeptide (TPR) repeat protein
VVPFNRNKNFVGREAQLKEIMYQLAPDDYERHCQRVAITGLGGIGKTQMALETAFRIREKISDCSVFWVSAANTTNFDSGYRQIAQQLQIPGIDDDKVDVKSLVVAYLGREDIGRWLLIVDNADDLKAFYTRDNQSGKSSETLRSQALADYLPKSKKGSILLTTRNRQIAVKHADLSVLTMREMSESESLDLLRKSLSDDTSITEGGASELLQVLTYLPLAIKQAAAYINEQQESIDGYLEICRSSDQELIQLLSEDFEDQGRYEGNTNPIALTWLISFRQIQQNDNLAAEYLFFMSCIAGQSIPHSLLPSLPTASKLKQSKAIGTLKAYAFVTSREGGKLYDIHRLVQLSVRNWLESEGEFDRRSCEALKHVAKMLPFYTHESRNECALYFPHAQCILALRKFPADMTGSLADLVHKAGEYFLQTGKYSEAENTYRQALELKRIALGDTHPSTLDNMNNLAVVYERQGKYAEAEALQKQTLKLKKAVLGDAHPSMLDSMNNLAVIYEQRGKYAEAEVLQKQTIKLKKTALGDAHPLTLDSMNNLAIIYQYQGKYAEAEILQEQTLKLKRVALGGAHPSTLDSMNNLAEVYRQQGKYAEAEVLQKQTLELVRTVLGGTHPSTLDSMNNLATVYRHQGKYVEAAALQQQTLKLKRTALGDAHPSTLDSMNNLAIVYLQQGKYAEAEVLQQQALKLTRATLGDAHPSTLGTMNNLATLYRRQGRYAEAEVLQQQTLKLARAALGPTHPSTFGTMNNLAIIYRDQGKHAEAEALRQQVLQLTRTPLW